MERTDGMLRMLRINFITSLDRAADFSWKPVLGMFTQLNAEQIAAIEHHSDAVLKYMICQRDNPNSIRNIIGRARENARGMQDHVTKEVWESLNEYYHLMNGKEIEIAIDNQEQILILGDLINRGLLFFGICEVTMPRGAGWDYMNLGKFTERAIQTVDILDVRFSQIDYDLNNPSDIPYWRNLLLSLSGYELYLKQYRGGLQSRNVADMAIFNPEFPRSILYCVTRLQRYLEDLQEKNQGESPVAQKQIGKLKARLQFTEMEEIAEMGLHRFLKDIRSELYAFGDALSRTYFAYY